MSSQVPTNRAAASRRNGARSRGPTTAAGKARARGNAVRHGLRARRLVLLADEDPAAFTRLHADLAAELAPPDLASTGALATELTARIAAAAWRARRADRLEAAPLGQHLASDPADPQAALGRGLNRDGNGPRAFDTLVRYRGAVLAELFRALATLQNLRRSEARRTQSPEAAGHPTDAPS